MQTAVPPIGEPYGDFICASVGHRSDYVFEEVDRRYRLYELRIDLMSFEVPELDGVARRLSAFLKSSRRGRCIVTCRAGRFSDAERFQLLRIAALSGADFIDVDSELPFELARELRELSRTVGTSFIYSYHNFESTDKLDVLKSWIERAEASLSPDLLKVATLVCSDEDAETLLSLCSPRVIVAGMGKLGVKVRCLAPLLGSPFTFAAAFESTAPDQPSYDELRQMILSTTADQLEKDLRRL
ncbi:type I 3-dehydroquinate dehydratase [Fervidobacterium thailandense]|uniref:3-dehydroquinate dehydratase n=1 Tax=Fervidobacterium thailandense TaxID=1008305 RepID=A0A1E3G189_9BACT|nr:type I 3-dehydroquinate dehydratase [Fervidobacterium thailandense]ODN30019.1 hypothetical protein A4H02_07520 [Fervidobacterium thailandense]